MKKAAGYLLLSVYLKRAKIEGWRGFGGRNISFFEAVDFSVASKYNKSVSEVRFVW